MQLTISARCNLSLGCYLHELYEETKPKQAANSHNPTEPDKNLKANWSNLRFLENGSINI